MVNYSERDDQMSRVFAALADPTRRAVLERLAQGPTSVGELAEPFAMSLPAVSKHLRVLERAGLLVQERDGRVRRCILVAEPLAEAAAWIARYQQFWSEQLDALAAFMQRLGGIDGGDSAESPPASAPSAPPIQGDNP